MGTASQQRHIFADGRWVDGKRIVDIRNTTGSINGPTKGTSQAAIAGHLKHFLGWIVARDLKNPRPLTFGGDVVVRGAVVQLDVAAIGHQ